MYEVSYGKTVVGKVQLVRQGLYYCVTCRCQMPDEQVYRLLAVTDGCKQNIGVVIPEGDGSILCKKIPVKKLDGQNICFILSSGEAPVSGKIIAVSPEEPFMYIDRLKNAFLQSENGRIRICIETNPETV